MFQNKILMIAAILISLVIVSQFAYINLLRSQKATLSAEKSTITALLGVSQANLTQLQNDITTQNAAIDKLKLDADERLIKHAADVKIAQSIAGIYKTEAEKLLNRLPPQNVTKCDAANLLIIEELKNARK